jgi:CRP-like cAMP-binding protein
MDSADKTAALAALLDCPPDVAGRMSGVCVLHAHAPHTIIAHQGDRSSHCWIILEGSTHVRLLSADGQYTQLTTFEAGELMGSYPAARTHRADVVAVGAVRLLQIGCADLHRLARSHADLGSGLATLFSRQFDATLDQFAHRITLTAFGRVYAELARLAEPEQIISPAPVIAALAIRAQTTRETASRAISALERRGVIRRSVDRIEIVAPRMLADMTV